MGRVINDIVSGRDGMEIVAGFDINRYSTQISRFLRIRLGVYGDCDVVIDFSNAALPSVCSITASRTSAGRYLHHGPLCGAV